MKGGFIMKFFDLEGNEISKADFISYYCDKYYERNCGHVAEDLIDKILYEQGEYSIIDIYYILAWKIDGIDKKRTNDSVSNPESKVYFYENRGWVESKLSGNNNGKPIELEKVLKLSSDLSEIKKEWSKKNFADDEKGASELLANLASSGAKEMGSVFYLTLLYFLTGSRWPIYDSMAYKSMIAIEKELIPNKDIVKYSQKLPEKSTNYSNYPDRLAKIVFENCDNQYREYIRFLKKFEKDLPDNCKYTASRDIDRALWEYGHYF